MSEETKKEIVPCGYPGCTSKTGANTAFDIKLNNEENAYAQIPFCKFHYYIVICGKFTVKRTQGKTPIEDKFELSGPLEEVSLIEQVMAARELTTPKVSGKDL